MNEVCLYHRKGNAMEQPLHPDAEHQQTWFCDQG
ncbi:Uncharacterised protein [Vibrio cholerae]|nr:Uncharacterised protein [Vibrio cholerae]